MVRERTQKGNLCILGQLKDEARAYDLAEIVICSYLIYKDRRKMLQAKDFFCRKDLQAGSKWLHICILSEAWVGKPTVKAGEICLSGCLLDLAGKAFLVYC